MGRYLFKTHQKLASDLLELGNVLQFDITMMYITCVRCEDSFAVGAGSAIAALYTVFVLKGQTHQQRGLYMIHNKVDRMAKQGWL